MEKRKPTYDLVAIKAQFATVEGIRITRTARRTALEVGIQVAEIPSLVQGIERDHFLKSMTTYADSTLWQDVYNVPYEGMTLYVKFGLMSDESYYLLVSLKER